MKKCPSCNRTYADDALSFCLDDGSPLLSVGESGPDPSDPHATLNYTPARETNPPPTEIYVGGSRQGRQHAAPTPSWTQAPGAGMTGPGPPKKSKAIYWIFGIVAALIVVGIGGVILVVVLAGLADSNANNANSNNTNRGVTNVSRDTNTRNTNNATSVDSTGKEYLVQDDFSSPNWWTGSNAFGKAEYVNGEYHVTATNNGYVVVYGPKSNAYRTEHATARVTARSVSGTSPRLGYGLVVYGELKAGNLEDYAFLIRTTESPAFSVAMHRDRKETHVVNWTRSNLVRKGTLPNQLEVRTDNEKLSFYINGQHATDVTATTGYVTGLVGLYSTDTEPIAFDDLAIFR